MPYAVEKRASKFCVVKEATGEIMPGGEHRSEEEALSHMAALYSAEESEERADGWEDVERDESGRWNGGGRGGSDGPSTSERMARAAERKKTENFKAAKEASGLYHKAKQAHAAAVRGGDEKRVAQAKEAMERARSLAEATKVAHWKATAASERKDGRVTVRRFDVLERLDGPTLLPNGWLKADAAIARTGIQEYRRGDGSVRREFRPPEEVFDSAAMESFAMVPVTDNHPADGLLTAENTREYQRGHLGETVRRDGDRVRATVLVTDADLVKRVLAGKQQLSAGYVCDLEDAPGEYQGERYDCVQRSVKGNHVAVVDVARGGPELRLKLDAADGEALPLDTEEDPAIRGDREENAPPEREASAREHPMVKIKIDGIEVEVANEQGAQLIERALASREEKADTAEKAVKQVRADAEQAATTAKSETEAFRARATVAESKVTELEKTRKDAQDALPGLVRARVALEEKAKGILGAEAKLDELSDRKIKEAVVVKLLPDVKLDGEPDGFVEAVYRGALVSQEKTASSRGVAAARAATGTPPGRQDADEHLDADEIRKKNLKATEDAWKKPSVGVTA